MTATSDEEGMTAVPLHPEWPSVLSDQGGLITIASEGHLERAITIREPRPEARLHTGALLSVVWDLDPVYERAVGTYPYTFSGAEILLAYIHPDRGGVIAGREQVGPSARACDIRIPEDAAAGAYKVAVDTIVENRTIPVFGGSQAVASAVQDITILPADGYFFLQPGRSGDYYQGHTLCLIWNAVGDAQEGDVDIELFDRSGTILAYIGRYNNLRPTQTRHATIGRSAVREPRPWRMRGSDSPI